MYEVGIMSVIKASYHIICHSFSAFICLLRDTRDYNFLLVVIEYGRIYELILNI